MDKLKPLIRSLRPHQWMKNLLIFIPLIAAHTTELYTIKNTILIFFGFCAISSAGYLFNDILDRKSDKAHPIKKERPIPKGELSVKTATLTATGLLILTLPALITINWAVGITALIYILLTGTYSKFLKHQKYTDIFILSCFSLIRVHAGGQAADVEISQWLFAFIFSVSISIAAAKRSIEIQKIKDIHLTRKNYGDKDLTLCNITGVNWALIASFVLSIYIMEQAPDNYENPDILWFPWAAFSIWFLHFWDRTSKGVTLSDPVKCIITNPYSYLAGTIMIAGFLSAI